MSIPSYCFRVVFKIKKMKVGYARLSETWTFLPQNKLFPVWPTFRSAAAYTKRAYMLLCVFWTKQNHLFAHRTLGRMQECSQFVIAGQQPVMKKGHVEPIDISVASRGSNKKVGQGQSLTDSHSLVFHDEVLTCEFPCR